MSEYVSALMVSEDTLNVNGVLFDRRSAQVTATPMDGTAKGRRIESLYHGEIQRMELCQRIVHLEQLVALAWQAIDGDADALRRARSETRALGLG